MMRITAFLLSISVASAIAGGLPFAHYGVLDTPSASLLRHTEIAFGGGASVYTTEDSAGNSNTDVGVAGYLEVGLFGRGQVGGTYLGSGGFSATARGLALAETLERPGIAVGVENLIGEENYEFYADTGGVLYQYPTAQNFSIYGVVSKDFNYILSVPICVNLGYGTGRFQQSSEAVDGIENPIPGLFGSILYHPTMESEVMIEWDGRDLNAGGYYRINRSITVQVAGSELEHLFVAGDTTTAATDVMQTPKFSLGVMVALGPFLNRTELDPYERLRYTEDDEALRQLEEYRARAREEIQELEDSIR